MSKTPAEMMKTSAGPEALQLGGNSGEQYGKTLRFARTLNERLEDAGDDDDDDGD